MVAAKRISKIAMMGAATKRRVVRDTTIGLLLGIISFYGVVPIIVGETGLLREHGTFGFLLFWFSPFVLFPAVLVVTALLRPQKCNEGFWAVLRVLAACFLILILDYGVKGPSEFHLTARELAEDLVFASALWGGVALLLAYIASRVYWGLRLVFLRLVRR